jgi:hypothetical protein
MNYRLHNQDLVILQREAKAKRFGRVPAWTRVTWAPTPLGGNMVYIVGLALPDRCSAPRTDVKLEAPPNLYEPAGNGRLVFYRNLYVRPGIRVFWSERRQWVPMPRLFGRDADGFAYLCIHPGDVAPGKNVLDFIRVFDLFLFNPGYKAASHEVI